MQLLTRLFINFCYLLLGLVLLYFAYYAVYYSRVSFDVFMLVTVIFSVFLTVFLAHADWYKTLKKRLKFYNLVFVYFISMLIPFLVFQLNTLIPVKEEYVSCKMNKARSVTCDNHTCYYISYDAPFRVSNECAVDSSLCYTTDSILVKKCTGLFFIDTYVEEFKLPPSAKKKPREVWYQDPNGWQWTTSTWINQ